MGHVTVVGGCRAKAPSTGILASALPVGSVVKLMEGGAAVEYLVVNQGIPENSSLYDASCDGTWLLRKDIHSNRQWDPNNVNKYESSAINTWLNGEFFITLGSAEQAAIKDRMDLARFVLAPGFNAETPRLDALVPVRAGKAVIVFQAGAGEQKTLAVAVGIFQRLIDQGASAGVRSALPEQLTAAI